MLALVLALMLASLVKTRLKLFHKTICWSCHQYGCAGGVL